MAIDPVLTNYLLHARAHTLVWAATGEPATPEDVEKYFADYASEVSELRARVRARYEAIDRWATHHGLRDRLAPRRPDDRWGGGGDDLEDLVVDYTDVLEVLWDEADHYTEAPLEWSELEEITFPIHWPTPPILTFAPGPRSANPADQ